MKKRTIKVWDVFRHKNWSRQRKVIEISNWDWVFYHDWIWYWWCSIAHFFSVCPKEVIITKKDLDVASNLRKEYWYDICLDAVNAKYEL